MINAVAIPSEQYDRQAMPPPARMVLSSGSFIDGFVPPDYHLDGITQRRFLYSMTAPTGSGKTAILLRLAAQTALGMSLAGREIVPGRVVYFAGENPDDVRMRWVVMSEKMGFDARNIDVHFIPGAFSIGALQARIVAEIETIGGCDLVIIDTSAAYFPGNDENSNVEMGKHARQLRTLTTLPGKPCVLVACHPVKNAGTENLLPRGGGAFLAEVDGNLVCIKRDSIVDVHWQGKFRGPDFEAIGFRLETVTSEKLRDSRGRRLPAVVAIPITESDRADMQAPAMRDEDQLILLLAKGVFSSVRNTAEALGWLGRTGEAQKSKVHAALMKLKGEGMAKKSREKWELTPQGQQEAKRLENMQPRGWNDRSDA